MATTTNKEYYRLGLMVVLGTIIFIIGIYFIGQGQNIFKNTVDVYAEFSNVNGLMKGNNVRYAGVDIGTVRSIELEESGVIRVKMKLDGKIATRINSNANAQIGSDGLVGNMIININPGIGEASKLSDGDVIKSVNKIGSEDLLNSLSITIHNTEKLTEDLLRVTTAINKGEGILSALLNDTLMAHDLRQSISSLKIASNSISNSGIQLQNLIYRLNNDESSAIGYLLNDTLSSTRLRNILGNLEKSSESIKLSSSSVNNLLDDISTPNGPINYLLKDTLFTEKLQSTIINIEEGTKKFNENMEALKHNFLTRGYFRKQERELRKELKKKDNGN